MCDTNCSTALWIFWGSPQDSVRGSIKGHLINLLLSYCLYIVMRFLCAIILDVSFANGLLMGWPSLLTALYPVLPVCSLCTIPLLLADQLPNGLPDKILGICRRKWKEDLGMATEHSTTEKWAAILLFKAPSQLSSSLLYIFVFSKMLVSPSTTRNKLTSTSRSTIAKNVNLYWKEFQYQMIRLLKIVVKCDAFIMYSFKIRLHMGLQFRMGSTIP